MAMYNMEEIKKSPQFKIIENATRRKYPFVKSLLPYKEDKEMYQNMLFIDIYIDISDISKQYGCKIASYISYWMKEDKLGNSSTTLSHYFQSGQPCRAVINDMGEDLKAYITQMSKMNVLPKEHRISLVMAPISFITRYEDNKYPELVEYKYESPF